MHAHKHNDIRKQGHRLIKVRLNSLSVRKDLSRLSINISILHGALNMDLKWTVHPKN